MSHETKKSLTLHVKQCPEKAFADGRITLISLNTELLYVLLPYTDYTHTDGLSKYWGNSCLMNALLSFDAKRAVGIVLVFVFLLAGTFFYPKEIYLIFQQEGSFCLRRRDEWKSRPTQDRSASRFFNTEVKVKPRSDTRILTRKPFPCLVSLFNSSVSFIQLRGTLLLQWIC